LEAEGGKGEGNKMRSGGKSFILKGQDRPSCNVFGRQGHTESACRIRAKAMASAKKESNDIIVQCKKDNAESAQSFAAVASASTKQEESSDEDGDDKYKKAFMNSFMESWRTSKNNKNTQNNERKLSDNDTSDSAQNYSPSFKLVALKPNRAKMGIPTREVIGETTINGSKQPLPILIDTRSSSSIILKKFINKKVLVKNSRTTTEWTTLRGSSTKRKKEQ
jgi:hypothetical protein